MPAARRWSRWSLFATSMRSALPARASAGSHETSTPPGQRRRTAGRSGCPRLSALFCGVGSIRSRGLADRSPDRSSVREGERSRGASPPHSPERPADRLRSRWACRQSPRLRTGPPRRERRRCSLLHWTASCCVISGKSSSCLQPLATPGREGPGGTRAVRSAGRPAPKLSGDKLSPSARRLPLSSVCSC